MCQVVVYKRLKTMKNYNVVASKSVYGRLREVVAHGGSTVYTAARSNQAVHVRQLIRRAYFRQ